LRLPIMPSNHKSKNRNNHIGQASKKQLCNRLVAMQKPDPGSLRHLIVTNPSKRWYVCPELWTTDMLRQLGCVFQPSKERDPFDVPLITLKSFPKSLERDSAADSLFDAMKWRCLETKDIDIYCFFLNLIRLLDQSQRYAIHKPW
jgi:hypothetical protein